MASAGLGSADRHLRDLFEAGTAVGQGDGQLLARYAEARDGVAFEALVARHGPLVLATCRAILRDEHDVEDAFQATFLVLARRAGSIRGGQALAAWLHRVARRASLRLATEAGRRRRKEAEASAMKPPVESHAGPSPDPDLLRVVHEEVDRLPEGRRLPVILCDLQGLSYEQAAGQLRWTVPTFRNRLARARQELRGRLTRRGIAAPAVAALLAGSTTAAAAVIPPTLARATVAAATGGSASAGALALSHAITKGILMTQIKIAATAALAAMGLAAAGVIAGGAGRPDEPKSGPAATPAPAAKVAGPEDKVPAGMVEVRGRVVGPDGRPVPGATIRGACVDREGGPTPAATGGADGRFAIQLPKPDGADGVIQNDIARFPWLVGSAPGFGLGWTEGVLRPDRPAEQVVALAEPGTPIEGRLVDLEGRPIAGAQVLVSRVWFDAKGDLPGWIARARNGAVGNLWQGLENLELDRILAIEAKTGPDGRFKLEGLGRDRIADLLITGPGVATTVAHAFSRDEPEVRESDKSMIGPKPFIVHAPKFELALAPSKAVGGVARDQATGQPIAGLDIKAAAFDRSSLISAEGIEAKTDAEGRYRLEGLPKADAYRLFVTPAPRQPYNKSTLKAPANSPALEPVAFDFALKPGILVRGRVTDKATGRPVRGYANYYAFADNPNIREHPGFRDSYNTQAQLMEDGTFTLVALPGRGLIGVRAEEDRHKAAVVDATIPGYDGKLKSYNTEPFPCHLGDYHIIIPVDLGPEGGPSPLELQADPGRSVAVEVVDPDGQPLGGTTVKGKADLFQSSPFPEESPRFEIHALDPARPRRIVVTHEARGLIGSVILKGDEPGPVRIPLVPWGTVAGRIVDDEGKPRKSMFIASPTGSQNPRPESDDILPGSDWNNGIAVGNDGRFRVEGLVPGLRYGATARAGFEAFGDLFAGQVVAPGEVKDLGDLKVQPPKKQED